MKYTYGKNCDLCNVSFTYPTPSGATRAWTNHIRGKAHRYQTYPSPEKRTFKGNPGDLRRYGFFKAADYLEKKQSE